LYLNFYAHDVPGDGRRHPWGFSLDPAKAERISPSPPVNILIEHNPLKEATIF
jgi:hypothetical protein